MATFKRVIHSIRFSDGADPPRPDTPTQATKGCWRTDRDLPSLARTTPRAQEGNDLDLDTYEISDDDDEEGTRMAFCWRTLFGVMHHGKNLPSHVSYRFITFQASRQPNQTIHTYIPINPPSRCAALQDMEPVDVSDAESDFDFDDFDGEDDFEAGPTSTAAPHPPDQMRFHVADSPRGPSV